MDKYRLGKKQKRVILEVETGHEYLIFPKSKTEHVAEFLDYINAKYRNAMKKTNSEFEFKHFYTGADGKEQEASIYLSINYNTKEFKIDKDSLFGGLGFMFNEGSHKYELWLAQLKGIEQAIYFALRELEAEKLFQNIRQQKLCSFCSTPLRDEDYDNPNDFYLACFQHKRLAEIEAEKFFKENPDYKK